MEGLPRFGVLCRSTKAAADRGWQVAVASGKSGLKLEGPQPSFEQPPARHLQNHRSLALLSVLAEKTHKATPSHDTVTRHLFPFTTPLDDYICPTFAVALLNVLATGLLLFPSQIPEPAIMALISAKTILTSLSLFHITLAFFFLTSPVTVSDQALVFILGESMGMPHDRSFDAQSPPLAFLAVVLAMMGITDLVTLSLPEEICLVHHWGTQAPLRFLLTFLLLLYTFLFSATSPFYRADAAAGGWSTSPTAHSRSASYAPSSWGGDLLKNRVFFAFIFVEMVSWLWAWVTLREEKQEVMQRKARRRGSQSYR